MKKAIIVSFILVVILGFGAGYFFGAIKTNILEKNTPKTGNANVLIPSDSDKEQTPINYEEELKKVDFSTPEKTMSYYLKFIILGDMKGVGICYAAQYPLSNFSKPIPIKKYYILKKIIYNQEYIDKLIKEGGMPSPPFQSGDVELQVKKIYSAGESNGPMPYKDGQEEMFSYWFRKSGENWFMTAGVSWNED